ncbi:hypothetical protein CEXT_150821 [Caerostris extrusa]|uniref:Uncharacterized protein n=1 Tax=Caerostris extrusa TaxID=172846 RepID=A0AAV4P9I6_CAEEX|nr:hypothetical protein CEXT_150821 [Caerostris extrusa]
MHSKTTLRAAYRKTHHLNQALSESSIVLLKFLNNWDKIGKYSRVSKHEYLLIIKYQFSYKKYGNGIDLVHISVTMVKPFDLIQLNSQADQKNSFIVRRAVLATESGEWLGKRAPHHLSEPNELCNTALQLLEN